MLQTIWQYGAKQLEEDEGALALRQRYATFFVSYAKALPTYADTPSHFELLRADLDNFRATLTWLRFTGSAEAELSLAVSLFRLWIVGGYAAEGRRTVQDALLATPSHPPKLRAAALRLAGAGIGYSLEGLAAFCSLHKYSHDAAQFLGAAEVLFEGALISPEPAERELREQTIAVLQGDLGDTQLAQEWARGRERDLNETIEYALSSIHASA
jgi:hypothetical protein